jgi:hypothetical protein
MTHHCDFDGKRNYCISVLSDTSDFFSNLFLYSASQVICRQDSWWSSLIFVLWRKITPISSDVDCLGHFHSWSLRNLGWLLAHSRHIPGTFPSSRRRCNHKEQWRDHEKRIRIVSQFIWSLSIGQVIFPLSLHKDFFKLWFQQKNYYLYSNIRKSL